MTTNKPKHTISGQSALGPGSGADYLDHYLPYLASPPVLATEPNAQYTMLRRELFNELRPESVLEAQFIEDVVYNTWQIRRLRQAQLDLVQRALIEVGTEELSVILFANKHRNDLKIETLGDAKAMAIVMIQNALAGDQAAAEVIENVLMDMKQLSWAGLHALAIDQVMASYSRLEQMTHLCERQRQALFKDYVFIGQAKAMLLQQRSNEAIAQIPCPAAAESLTGRPEANTTMTGNLAASNTSVASTTAAANGPKPALAGVEPILRLWTRDWSVRHQPTWPCPTRHRPASQRQIPWHRVCNERAQHQQAVCGRRPSRGSPQRPHPWPVHPGRVFGQTVSPGAAVA